MSTLCTQNVGAKKYARGPRWSDPHGSRAAKLTMISGFSSSNNLFTASAVADVSLDETKIRPIHHGGEGRKIARVCQLIQAHDAILRMMFQLIKNEIGNR